MHHTVKLRTDGRHGVYYAVDNGESQPLPPMQKVTIDRWSIEVWESLDGRSTDDREEVISVEYRDRKGITLFSQSYVPIGNVDIVLRFTSRPQVIFRRVSV